MSPGLYFPKAGPGLGRHPKYRYGLKLMYMRQWGSWSQINLLNDVEHKEKLTKLFAL